METPPASAPPRRASSRLAALSTLREASTSATAPMAAAAATPPMALRWRPFGESNARPELVVTQGNLTTALVDAVVVPTTGGGVHGGGLASAIVTMGGSEIADDYEKWGEEYGPLAVGRAMPTRAGNLPCRYVIHAVGPSVGFGGVSNAETDREHLCNAVRSALWEAERLQVASVAIPVISSGHFGFPVAVAATDIVNECVRFVMEMGSGSLLKTIVLMGSDVTAYASFANALQVAAVFSETENAVEQVSGLSFNVRVETCVAKAPKLRLKKAVTPQSPFEFLSPDGPEYNRVVRELSVYDKARVVSVRLVRTSACHAEYDNLKSELEGAQVEEKEPIYHGTPQRWRATAIALKGFNRNLFPGGPSHLHGVYTSTNLTLALGYTRGGGSLLQLRGLVVSSTESNEHMTIVGGDGVHIFPNPKALCSVMIIDFAPEDELDRKQLQQQRLRHYMEIGEASRRVP